MDAEGRLEKRWQSLRGAPRVTSDKDPVPLATTADRDGLRKLGRYEGEGEESRRESAPKDASSGSCGRRRGECLFCTLHSPRNGEGGKERSSEKTGSMDQWRGEMGDGTSQSDVEEMQEGVVLWSILFGSMRLPFVWFANQGVAWEEEVVVVTQVRADCAVSVGCRRHLVFVPRAEAGAEGDNSAWDAASVDLPRLGVWVCRMLSCRDFIVGYVPQVNEQCRAFELDQKGSWWW